MTKLRNPVTRALNKPVDGTFCADNGRPLAVRLVPGNDDLPDMLEVWPKGTRRVERIALIDVYRFSLRCRVNRQTLEKARMKKERKAIRLAQERQRRAEKRLIAK